MIKEVKAFFKRNAYRRPTLTEIVARELERETREAEDAQATIRNHEFMLHMARAKINALNAWNIGAKSQSQEEKRASWTIFPTCIYSAPQGWGKTRNAESLRSALGCVAVVDDWDSGQMLKSGALHLTNEDPDSIFEALNKENPNIWKRVRFLSSGWNAKVESKESQS